MSGQGIYGTVPRLWAGETVVCIGGGPSLNSDDVMACRGRARVIAINDAYKLAPWADVLYACDYAWWRAHGGVPMFSGLRFSLDRRASRYGVQILQNTGVAGLELEPTGLRTGHNGGYQAINLAVHFGARRIVLLGYDMQRTDNKAHWFGDHPTGLNNPPLPLFIPQFEQVAPLLRARGIDVINSSRETALTMFPRQSLQAALSVAVAA